MEMIKIQPWAAGVVVDGEVVRVTVKDIAQARREMLASAVAQEVLLRRFEETRPSLEDVFLQLVNKEAVQ
jgi:ABC-type uncharacterized transport system ATPase subunit